MTEKTRKIIVFSTLPLAIVWAVYNLGGSKKVEPQAQPATIAPLSVASVPQAIRQTIPSDATEELDSASWGADPFRAYVRSKPRSRRTASVRKSWKLSGILYSRNNPVAIINGRPIRIGEEIQGATIIDIDRDKVLLDNNGSRKTLTISKG